MRKKETQIIYIPGTQCSSFAPINIRNMPVVVSMSWKVDVTQAVCKEV